MPLCWEDGRLDRGLLHLHMEHHIFRQFSLDMQDSLAGNMGFPLLGSELGMRFLEVFWRGLF